MDIFEVLLQTALITSGIVLYLIFFKTSTSTERGRYVRPGWNFPIKLLWARYAVRRWKKRKGRPLLFESLHGSMNEGFDSLTIRGCSAEGTAILLVLRKLYSNDPLAEITIVVQLPDGTIFQLPRHPDTVVSKWFGSTWSAGGLKVEVLESLRRLRITYNGILQRIDTNSVHHATFSFIWCTGSKVFCHPEDWSEDLAAYAIALDPWRDGKWPLMLDKWEDGGWMQWGSLQGWFETESSGDVGSVKMWLRTPSIRKRYWAPNGYKSLRRSVCLLLMAKDGTAVYLRAHSYRKNLTQVLIGSVRFPNSTVEAITSTDFNLAEFCELRNNLFDVYTININTKSKNLRIMFKVGKQNRWLLSGVLYQHQICFRTLLGDINGEIAGGILELGCQVKERRLPAVPITPVPYLQWSSLDVIEDADYCVRFESKAATCPALVGGKGASLALLASVQYDEGYIVPPGFCVTTRAFESHVKENPDLIQAIEAIEQAHQNYNEQIFKEKCEIAVELFANTKMSEKLKWNIEVHLGELREKSMKMLNLEEVPFAVRSSAIGEDSEALSAAGQNETVLGCRSNEDVLRAVLACWGSMYAFTSAYYRRQNGQECLSGAGVVVQTLVSGMAAGVMFTRHPTNGDPSKMIITANYGLGESVVSGSVEPDTFTVFRSLEDRLSIASIDLGSKMSQIMSSDTGTVSKEVSAELRRKACLSPSQVLKLARLGLHQEELWGAPRDIEWSMDQNHVYMLQARPITGLERWTEEELLHEMDTPILSDNDLLTFANVGEILPKTLSPMAVDLVFTALTDGGNEQIMGDANGFQSALFITHNRMTINLYNSVYRIIPSTINMMLRISEMILHGHPVADDRIHAIGTKRSMMKFSDTVKNIWNIIKMLYNNKSIAKYSSKYVRKMDIDKLDIDYADRLLEAIERSRNDILTISQYHNATTISSTLAQIISMFVLTEGATEFTADHCSDLATLSSGADTVSAEVPTALTNLSQGLASSGRLREFRDVRPQEGMQWLRKHLPHFHLELLMFLEKHGHRCLMEMDLASVPWSLAPESLIRVLQTMDAPVIINQNMKTDREIIESLVTPKKPRTRTLLRWLLPLCRRTAASRETTKSQLILAIHKVRIAFRRLGKLMVHDWMLPEADLVFYFTQFELRQFIETRNPELLRKAKQRRQYYPKWDLLRFAEIQEGWPSPEPPNELFGICGLDPVTRMVATPVCVGEVVARACVIHDLSQIGQLKQGDILVTRCTDIGWSPYFPMLGGLVTELGGLISHGAVIARECGLPCVVGAIGATQIFNTNDLLLLCGSTGVIQKLDSKSEQTLLDI